MIRKASQTVNKTSGRSIALILAGGLGVPALIKTYQSCAPAICTSVTLCGEAIENFRNGDSPAGFCNLGSALASRRVALETDLGESFFLPQHSSPWYLKQAIKMLGLVCDSCVYFALMGNIKDLDRAYDFFQLSRDCISQAGKLVKD